MRTPRCPSGALARPRAFLGVKIRNFSSHVFSPWQKRDASKAVTPHETALIDQARLLEKGQNARASGFTVQ
jgi:hypothetical protein